MAMYECVYVFPARAGLPKVPGSGGQIVSPRCPEAKEPLGRLGSGLDLVLWAESMCRTAWKP